MGEPAERERMSASAYLEWERGEEAKHEFHLGEVFAMAGGSPRHNYLAAALLAELRSALRGGPCRVLSSDQRISARGGERYLYADAVVVCGELRTDPAAPEVLTNPSVVVEVLSPSTEAYDRGLKWEAYREIPSLSDYLLVSQSAARVEHFAREEGGSWRYRALQPGQSLRLSIGAVIELASIFEGAFEIESAREEPG